MMSKDTVLFTLPLKLVVKILTAGIDFVTTLPAAIMLRAPNVHAIKNRHIVAYQNQIEYTFRIQNYFKERLVHFNRMIVKLSSYYVSVNPNTP